MLWIKLGIYLQFSWIFQIFPGFFPVSSKMFQNFIEIQFQNLWSRKSFQKIKFTLAKVNKEIIGGVLLSAGNRSPLPSCSLGAGGTSFKVNSRLERRRSRFLEQPFPFTYRQKPSRKLKSKKQNVERNPFHWAEKIISHAPQLWNKQPLCSSLQT